MAREIPEKVLSQNIGSYYRGDRVLFLSAELKAELHQMAAWKDFPRATRYFLWLFHSKNHT